MRHPDLPSEQVIEVEDRLVAGHRASGWVVTDPPPKPEPQPEPDPDGTVSSEEAPAALPVGEKSQRAPEKPSRRRAPKEGDEK
jgi:hypothetical protein